MPFTGLSILSRGWHHPGSVDITTGESPTITSVVEVRPTLRVEVMPTAPSGTGTPAITSAIPLTPEIVSADGPQQDAGTDEPEIIGAENLVPTITKAEEE